MTAVDVHFLAVLVDDLVEDACFQRGSTENVLHPSTQHATTGLRLLIPLHKALRRRHLLLLRVQESGVFCLMLAQNLRKLRMVQLVALVVGTDYLVPPLAHLFDGDGRELED